MVRPTLHLNLFVGRWRLSITVSQGSFWLTEIGFLFLSPWDGSVFENTVVGGTRSFVVPTGKRDLTVTSDSPSDLRIGDGPPSSTEFRHEGKESSHHGRPWCSP